MKKENAIIAENIKYCMKKEGISVRGLAKQYDGDPNNRTRIYKWINGTVIPQTTTIETLEDIFHLPHGALSNPLLPIKYENFRNLYDLLNTRPVDFEDGEDFLAAWNNITEYANNNPDQGEYFTIEHVSVSNLFHQFIELLGYTDYDIKSEEFKDLFEGTKTYIANKHKRNRPT